MKLRSVHPSPFDSLAPLGRLALPALLPLLALLGAALPASAAEPASAAKPAPAETRPALREAAMPRRTPAIVLPSVDEMRAAARAETARPPPPGASGAAAAAAAAALPAVAVPGVVLPPANEPVSEPASQRKRAPERGFLPPLPRTAPPVARAAEVPLPAPAEALAPGQAADASAPAPAAPLPDAVTSPPAPASAAVSLPPAAQPPAAAPIAPPVASPVASPPTPAPVAEAPPPDPDSADPLERLRARLKERLAAVKPPDADSPYELQVSTRAVAGAAAKRPVGRSSGSQKARRSKPPAAALAEGEWAYEGERGPASWGGLCATGKRQSPIDIREGLPVALEPIGFHYQSGSFSVLDTGHTVQVNVAPGNFAQLGERRFELKQFHFHRPSEETLDGRRFDLSVHLVHRDDQGRRLIVAVLVQRGSAQPVLRSVFGNLPLEKRQENQARISLNPADLLPSEQAYYTYMGSLTTPPCSEDVQWVVLRHPVAASPEQIELFGRLYTDNIRPLQQADGRRILQTP